MARAHGAGTLVKRGKYWMAKWMVKGKMYTRTTKCTNEHDARKKLEEFTKPFRENSDIEVIENLAAKVRVIESNAKSELNDSAPPLKVIFLLDVCKKDLNAFEIKASTEATYESMVSKFHKFTKIDFVHEVTKEDVVKFLHHIKPSVGVGRYNGYITVMHKLFEVAKKYDYRIRINPWDGFVLAKKDKSKKRRELTSNEVKLLCETAYEYDEELGLMFEIAVYTGLRRSDCQHIKWSNIDFENKIINLLPIKTSKTGMEARIPLHPKLLERLKSIKRENEYVMPNVAKLSNNRISYLERKIFTEAGIKIYEKDDKGKKHIVTGFHAFRHYFISNCVKNGIPVSVIQRMVAHTTPSMSLEYTHTFDKDLRLPDYEGEYEQLTLKKTTVAALNKAKGILDVDDFIMKLLEGKPVSQTHAKTKADIELEKELDAMFGDK